MSVVEHPTGAQLYAELCAAARREGVSVRAFALPLFHEPTAHLEQLRIAKAPKANTVARVRALIAGDPLPPKLRSHKPAQDHGRSRAGPSSPTVAGACGEIATIGEIRLSSDIIEARRRLTELARETRRPGQTLDERVRELKVEGAAQ